jgi:hypothetical protein
MLRDQNGDDDEDYQHEEQEGTSDAAASWRKVPRVVRARHLQSKQIERGFVRALPATGKGEDTGSPIILFGTQIGTKDEENRQIEHHNPRQ